MSCCGREGHPAVTPGDRTSRTRLRAGCAGVRVAVGVRAPRGRARAAVGAAVRDRARRGGEQRNRRPAPAPPRARCRSGRRGHRAWPHVRRGGERCPPRWRRPRRRRRRARVVVLGARRRGAGAHPQNGRSHRRARVWTSSGHRSARRDRGSSWTVARGGRRGGAPRDLPGQGRRRPRGGGGLLVLREQDREHGRGRRGDDRRCRAGGARSGAQQTGRHRGRRSVRAVPDRPRAQDGQPGGGRGMCTDRAGRRAARAAARGLAALHRSPP